MSPCLDTPKERRCALAATDECAVLERFPRPSRGGDVGWPFCKGWCCAALPVHSGGSQFLQRGKGSETGIRSYQAGQDPVLLDLDQGGVEANCVEGTHLIPISMIPKQNSAVVHASDLGKPRVPAVKWLIDCQY